jgi:hypothetical protein
MVEVITRPVIDTASNGTVIDPVTVDAPALKTVMVNGIGSPAATFAAGIDGVTKTGIRVGSFRLAVREVGWYRSGCPLVLAGKGRVHLL